MNKVWILFLFLMAGVFGSAVPDTEVSYFYSTGCSHCAKVLESGVLENLSTFEGVSLTKYETTSPVVRERYLDYLARFNIERGGIPFLVIERGSEASYLMGDSPIIDGSLDAIVNFKSMDIGNIEIVRDELDLWVVLGAALIDSINPCAFGVLLFLMAVLLRMGSAKRALRSGMIYTAVIFVVYLLAGLGIMRLAGDFLGLEAVKIFVGAIILAGAVIEFKDFFWEGKGFSLRIPKAAGPTIERWAGKGTFLSLIVLGGLVALVELPCTGGIYLAILSLISDSGAKGMFYLVLYNLVFVLPLVLISYFVYRGAKVEAVNEWVQGNKRFMRLAAGIVMAFLGGSLLGWF